MTSTTGASARPRTAPPGPDGYGYDVARPRVRRGAPGAPAGRPPRRRRRWVRWLLVALSVLTLLISSVVLYLYVILPMGVGTSLVAFTAALVPVALVLSAVWWIDRYTPQPRLSLVLAFAWGAIGSVLLTLFFGTYVDAWISPEEESELLDTFLGAVVQAPVVEEGMKSAGLLGLLGWGRKYIAGPIDGVVYAALIAGGFAFTENILYFGRSFHEAQAAGTVDAFWQTFFLRGILSPFAHVSFTSLCGLGLGIAAERRSVMLTVGLGAGGLSLGMLLHAVWNGSTFLLPVDPEAPMAGFLRYYVSVQVPIFVLLVGMVLFLRLREKRILRRQLSEYGRAGWFSPEEVEMLVSMRRRRRAEKWAGRHGAVARMGMRDLIRAAIALGMERHSVLFARPTARTRARERELLETITEDRRLVGALTAPVVRG